MHPSEARVKEELESSGWKVLRNGAPDFLAYREENGILRIRAIEVKTNDQGLTPEQGEYAALLRRLGVEFHVQRVLQERLPAKRVVNPWWEDPLLAEYRAQLMFLHAEDVEPLRVKIEGDESLPTGRKFALLSALDYRVNRIRKNGP